MWRDGKLLVILRGEPFPDRCIKTNLPAEGRRLKQGLHWQPWWATLIQVAAPWGVGEAASALTAAALGGHVRVGFENNLQLPDGTLAPDNAASVAAAAAGARAIGRPLADAAQARAILRAHVGAA